jgi:hypothetical protein
MDRPPSRNRIIIIRGRVTSDQNIAHRGLGEQQGMGDALATWFEAKTCVEGHVKNMRGGASTRSALTLAELCYHTPRPWLDAIVNVVSRRNPVGHRVR